GRGATDENEPLVCMERVTFLPPDRRTLPVLARYSRLHVNGDTRVVGYTEASRGCKHLCRHCPVVPVYRGQFRIVQAEVVLADIRAQVAGGAQHITFGDPDFLNGPTHARRIVEALHSEFPGVTYDITAKVEHLLAVPELLMLLRDTGCLFVTTAVESIEDAVLEKLEKRHRRADFLRLVGLCRDAGLTLAPTFIPFTPWTTRAGYRELLECLADLDLVDNVGPIQLALRLLITSGSRLLELEDVRRIVGPFDRESLMYPWVHADPETDLLARRIMAVVTAEQRNRTPRREVFRRIWEAAHSRPLPDNYDLLPRAVIPYMDEPWFC
ncbi:MAG TPA: radical SAM protein, partial [Bryobacteraceae bacterium]|nr:radical SAM protein [Bryobacteraceae bacterium]